MIFFSFHFLLDLKLPYDSVPLKLLGSTVISIFRETDYYNFPLWLFNINTCMFFIVHKHLKFIWLFNYLIFLLILKYQLDQSVITLDSDSGSLGSSDSNENSENVDQLFENASPMVIINTWYYFAYFYCIIFCF